MEMILLDKDLKEIGPMNLDVDFEVGDILALNDFELYVPSALDAYGVYIPDTEWGGIIEYDEGTTESESLTLKGWTWRGLLSQEIIEPPAGSDYRIVSGELNDILRDILSGVLGGFFVVPDVDTGKSITSHQFRLYTTVLEGLMDMLSGYGYRLKIYAKKAEAGGMIQVFCEAVPAVTIEGQYDEDTRLGLRFVRSQMGINHLVCMGTGQLQNRQRVDLYVQEDGSIGKTQYYTGLLERTAYYDYNNAESLEELEESGKKRLKELAGYKKLEITDVEGQSLEIGDIVIGRHRSMGITVEKPIIKKILTITGGKISIEYQVKGEE
ncbi:MAG: hypothetical protein ACI4EH_13195 [Oliverpabstia sp.]